MQSAGADTRAAFEDEEDEDDNAAMAARREL